MMMNSLFGPMSYFYEKLRLPIPEIRQVPPAELPSAERVLLAHDRDMTPTLEAAYRARLQIRILQYVATEESVHRLVALEMEGVQNTVGLGAIHIFTARLPAPARKLVLDRQEPFGRILQEAGVTHYGRPSAYFHVTADSVIMETLGLSEPCVLHGRRNTIWNASGEALADVVEILAPSKNIESGE